MKKLDSLNDGQKLKVVVSDKGFKKDITAWCKSTGNTLLDIMDEGTTIVAFIQKGADSLVSDGRGGTLVSQCAPLVKKTTLVLFSNDLDKAIAAFILATGFASLGHEVTIFFTFWGLNVLRKDNPPVSGKGFPQQNVRFYDAQRGKKACPVQNAHDGYGNSNDETCYGF